MGRVQQLYWQGIESRNSAEHCRLMRGAELMSAIGVVIGLEPVFRVDYIIRMDAQWRIQSLQVDGWVNEREMAFYLEKDDQNEWWRRENRVESLSGCTTIDLSVSPFTNSFAIQTLELLPGKSGSVRVAYVDILEGRISSASQDYTRINTNQYRFFTEPDFEAVITVDEDGLVTDYPGLFSRRM